MALSQIEQIKQLVTDAKHVLITFRKDATGDTIASATGLLLFLQKLDKTVDVVCDGFTLPKQYSFLKQSDAISDTFSHLQKFIITLDVEETGVEELSYDLKNQKLRIFVTPKKGFLTRKHVRTAQTDFKYDLIVTLGTQDLDALGEHFTQHGELFFKTPIINVDHDPSNERYGQINHVDLTASSTAEVLFDLMRKLGNEFVDEHIATALLTGMIAQTRSFKADSVKPHSLTTASTLMNMGANREQIVCSLYQTRTIPTLKLWGYALTHLQQNKEKGLVWSTITRDDVVRSGSQESDLQDVVHELIITSPEAKVILLLHEHVDNGNDQMIHGMVHTDKIYDAKQLVHPFKPEGTAQDVSFTIRGKTLKEAESLVTEHIQRQL